jgi:hypothetical protein
MTMLNHSRRQFVASSLRCSAAAFISMPNPLPVSDARNRVGTRTAPPQIGYSGALSSSPEESLEHAQQCVAAPNSGRNTIWRRNRHQ